MTEERLIRMEDMLVQLVGMVGSVKSDVVDIKSDMKEMTGRMESLEESNRHTIEFFEKKFMEHDKEIFALRRKVFPV